MYMVQSSSAACYLDCMRMMLPFSYIVGSSLCDFIDVEKFLSAAKSPTLPIFTNEE